MKTLKKALLAFLFLVVISSLGGYLYFDIKFTPPDNHLNVSKNAEKISLEWLSENNTPYAAVLLPVTITGIDYPLYMQLDLGSPITVFYSNSLQSLRSKFPQLPPIENNAATVDLSMNVGEMSISSNNFQLLDYGANVNFYNTTVKNIIGTIGTDVLEKRIIILDFVNNQCSFVKSLPEIGFCDFEFKKRKILMPAKIDQEELKLMYDSGTSSYELITNKNNWQKYKTKNSSIKKEKGNSWGKSLDVISSPANKEILFSDTRLKLREVTYIEGTSALQNALMRFSGMQGMIGNKIFFNHKVIIDCKNEKFKIE